MEENKFLFKNFGPIREVNVDLGDLTVLIGAQASGKSLFLQMFKLIKDRFAILKSLENYGFVVNNKKLGDLINRCIRKRPKYFSNNNKYKTRYIYFLFYKEKSFRNCTNR